MDIDGKKVGVITGAIGAGVVVTTLVKAISSRNAEPEIEVFLCNRQGENYGHGDLNFFYTDALNIQELKNNPYDPNNPNDQSGTINPNNPNFVDFRSTRITLRADTQVQPSSSSLQVVEFDGEDYKGERAIAGKFYTVARIACRGTPLRIEYKWNYPEIVANNRRTDGLRVRGTQSPYADNWILLNKHREIQVALPNRSGEHNLELELRFLSKDRREEVSVPVTLHEVESEEPIMYDENRDSPSTFTFKRRAFVVLETIERGVIRGLNLSDELIKFDNEPLVQTVNGRHIYTSIVDPKEGKYRRNEQGEIVPNAQGQPIVEEPEAWNFSFMRDTPIPEEEILWDRNQQEEIVFQENRIQQFIPNANQNNIPNEVVDVGNTDDPVIRELFIIPSNPPKSINPNNLINNPPPTRPQYRNPTGTRSLRKIDMIAVHHTEGAVNPTMELFNTTWTSMPILHTDLDHVYARRWCRSGYHFLINENGDIWQLIPLHFSGQGIWIPSYVRNRRLIQIVFAGNFFDDNPSQLAQNAFVNLCELLMIHPDIPNLRLTAEDQSIRIAGHRTWNRATNPNLRSDCPGFTENNHREWRNVPHHTGTVSRNSGGDRYTLNITPPLRGWISLDRPPT